MAYTQTVPLGTAVNFALLAGSGITIAGAVNSSNATGDIGTFPTTTITGIGNLVLNGTNHAGDPVTQGAKLDLTAAYVDAAARPVTGTIATELGGTTVLPGVYDSAAGDFQITGVLTIDAQGDPNSVFIFKTASTFITAPGASMSLIGGAQACNIFFIVGSSATLDTTSAVSANIIALTSITLNTGATLDGRALARNGAVTLDENTVTESVCANQSASTFMLTELISDSVCLDCLSASEKEQAYLFYLATALVGSGGTDYTNINTLREAVACWCVGGQRLDSFKARVAITAAVNSGGVETEPTIAEVRAAIKCWCGIGGGERQAMEVFLLDALLGTVV